MIRGVIFDLGGTLMYFEGQWQEVDKASTAALVAFLKDNGIQVADPATLGGVGDDFHARFLEQRQAGWKLAEQTLIEHTVEEALGKTLVELGHFSPDSLLPRAVQVYFALVEQHWHAYPDAIATLQALHRRGLHIGLISNADDDGLVQRAVKRLGFAPYLNPVISSAGAKWRKPDPRIFLLVADEWQLPPDEIAMVGDVPAVDILGAHRAGMRGILIDRGDNAPWQKIPDELANDPAVKPDWTVNTLAEIPASIERL